MKFVRFSWNLLDFRRHFPQIPMNFPEICVKFWKNWFQVEIWRDSQKIQWNSNKLFPFSPHHQPIEKIVVVIPWDSMLEMSNWVILKWVFLEISEKSSKMSFNRCSHILKTLGNNLKLRKTVKLLPQRQNFLNYSRFFATESKNVIKARKNNFSIFF